MLFNSVEFLYFFPIVFLLYWFCFNRSLKWQNILLLVASYFFYAWWSWKFLILLALSTLLDFFYGFKVADDDKKISKRFLWLSIINNLGILGIFKYYNFFAIQFQQGFALLHIAVNPVLLNIALPVGISFYTFHGMSYVFDIYRGVRKPVKNFTEYAVFVSFFPLLVSGPIERANHLLPQVQSKRVFNYAQAVEGGRLILWGMFKKVVIADSLSVIVDNVFNNYHQHNAFALITSAIAFSFQIYGDFSGYTDIALGTAKLLGFELLSNFKFPYFSRNIAEFWRRWHISLSSWFRDYLYIPLGGSKEGSVKAVRNIFIIFIVSGFWHGANWNFITWGFIHACGFLPVLLLNRNRKYTTEVVAYDRKLPTIKELLQMISTFIFVTFAWIFFRSHELKDALGYIKRIIVNSIQHPGQFLLLPSGWNAFIYILPLIMGDWWMRRDERKLRAFKKGNFFLYAFITTLILVFLVMSTKRSFIYFQF
jgi:alginate O-acetyltransferase complex protein AlgI